MTPHIQAKKGEIAKVVLMPGDPLRAKYIAETFLDNYKLVNTVRNMFMYTGTYQGKEISICGSGMGQPSIGIYSYELFKFYDVDKIIRIGSAGSYTKRLNIYDVVLVTKAHSDSDVFSRHMLDTPTHWALPSEKLNQQITKIAADLKIPIFPTVTNSSDVFYSNMTYTEIAEKTQTECVEMESYALFVNAIATNKQAACLLTISDNFVTEEVTTPEERQTAFDGMMKIALKLGE